MLCLNIRLCYVLLKLTLFSFYRSKIVELEEELRVVGNNLKSLEVSEEKVIYNFSRYEKCKEYLPKQILVFATISLQILYSTSIFIYISNHSSRHFNGYLGKSARRRI